MVSKGITQQYAHGWPPGRFFSFVRKRNGQTANNADISFRNIPIPENANGTCMQLNADISIAEMARAHQIAARVLLCRVFLLV